MYVENLQALVLASEMSEQSSAGYVNAITSPELKEMVASGAKIAKEHTDTIKDLLRAAGGQPSQKPNQVMAGIIAAGKDSVTSASDPRRRRRPPGRIRPGAERPLDPRPGRHAVASPRGRRGGVGVCVHQGAPGWDGQTLRRKGKPG